MKSAHGMLLLLAMLGAVVSRSIWQVALACVSFEIVAWFWSRTRRHDENPRDTTLSWLSGSVCGLIILGVALLGGLTSRVDLSEVQTVLRQAAEADTSLAETLNWRLVAARCAAVSVVVAACVMLGAAPLDQRMRRMSDSMSHWDGWLWSHGSRCLGACLLWKVGAIALAPLGTSLLPCLVAVSVLTLLKGAASLWQREDPVGITARLVTINTGTLLLAVAAGMDEVDRGTSTVQPLMGAGPVALLFITSVVGSALVGVADLCLGRIRFTDELAGVSRQHRLLAFVLGVGLISLTPLPPLPGFWCWISLVISVFIPTLPAPEPAAALASPAVLVGLGFALAAQLAAVVRVMQLVIVMSTREPLGPRPSEPSQWLRWGGLAGAALMLIAGLVPQWGVADVVRLTRDRNIRNAGADRSVP